MGILVFKSALYPSQSVLLRHRRYVAAGACWSVIWICRWSDPEGSCETLQSRTLPIRPGVHMVLSITSCLLESMNVNSSLLFRMISPLLIRYSCRFSPLSFVFVLPHPEWWEFGSHPTKSSNPRLVAKSTRFLNSSGGGESAESQGMYAEPTKISAGSPAPRFVFSNITVTSAVLTRMLSPPAPWRLCRFSASPRMGSNAMSRFLLGL